MIELGKKQILYVVRKKEFGVYLGAKPDSQEAVLLPKKYLPEHLETGDQIEVFIYKDSSDRLIATTMSPKLQVGEIAWLTVKEISKIGVFLDMGLEKDLLLPFREQVGTLIPGDRCMVALYIDKSARLAATMKISSYLSSQSPFQINDKVSGIIYEVNDRLGAFVVVADQYHGLIPQRELFTEVKPGDHIQGRVIAVREDGKLDLSIREKSYLQMDLDVEAVERKLEQLGGVIPFTDKAEPELIKQTFGLSKNAFKRAVGRMLKDKKIVISENTIEKL